MREFRKFVSQWLGCLGIRDKDVSRQIIHHWIKNYEPYLESIISFHEAREYCKGLLSEVTKNAPKGVVERKTVSHVDALQVLEDTFGQRYCFDLVHRDEEFFDELCDIASKYKVYCWKLLDKEGMGRERRLFLARS